MKTYKAVVRREMEITVEFTEEECEGEEPEIAAVELALSEPMQWWDDEWGPEVMDMQVSDDGN